VVRGPQFEKHCVKGFQCCVQEEQFYEKVFLKKDPNIYCNIRFNTGDSGTNLT
jgi:hypothetical protein